MFDLTGFPNKRHCECGGTLFNDFHTAYMCDTCKYYVINGKVITRCDGTLTAEFITCEYILYEGASYKLVRRDADIGDLILLNDTSLTKRIHYVKDYSGYHKRSVTLVNGDTVDSHKYYNVLVPLCEVRI